MFEFGSVGSAALHTTKHKRKCVHNELRYILCRHSCNNTIFKIRRDSAGTHTLLHSHRHHMRLIKEEKYIQTLDCYAADRKKICLQRTNG